MSEDNVAIVRSLYETWNRTGGDPPWELIDPDIEVEFTGGILKGRYRGYAGVAKALDSFWGPFDEARIDVEACRSSGNAVLVTLRYCARGKASGIEVDAPGWHVWRLREGRAVSWLVFEIRGKALEAAGLSE